MLELVILLPGNTVVVPNCDTVREQLEELIKKATEDGAKGHWLTFNSNYRIRADAIIAHYFREHRRSTAEQLVDQVKEQVAAVKKSLNSGDDWKDS